MINLCSMLISAVGCTIANSEMTNATIEVSSISDTSSISSNSSASNNNDPTLQYNLDNISFSDSLEAECPDSINVSFPPQMFSTRFLWIDSSHIYLMPGKNTEFGVIIDIERENLVQTAPHKLLWENVLYQDNCIFLAMNDYTIQKLDKDLNLISLISFGTEAENYICTVHPTSETLYYIQQDDPDNPLLCRKAEDRTEILTKLPPLEGNEHYDYPYISPSGDNIFFSRIHYEFLVPYIYFYNISTDNLIAAACEDVSGSGFWMPAGSWMGEQPVFLLSYTHEQKNINEILCGTSLESKIQSFYYSNDLSVRLNINLSSPWSCISYKIEDSSNFKNGQNKIFYFNMDNDSYLSCTTESNTSIYYPQLSPDYKYLAYFSSPGEQDSLCRICIISTEGLWKPLDWQQVQAVFDMDVSSISHEK